MSLKAACATLGIHPRTLTRWRRQQDGGEDMRRGPNSKPARSLTPEERAKIVAISTSPEYRNLSVRQIVPLLADEGTYVASESSFYRVLREEGLMAHRSAAKPPKHSKPKRWVATGPGEVWSWDITYLRGPVRGTFFYLYLLLDIWSRKIVGWEVHLEESMEHSAALVERTCKAERIRRDTLVLHSDNGAPMKGSTMLATLQHLGIVPSFSRPSVSDDNAICEALFRTLKYRPGFPRKPFASLEHARAWVESFVAWYNGEHLHSALRYVTPSDRHARRDVEILAQRHALYRESRDLHPDRWTGATRNWTPIGDVALNPDAKGRAA